MNKILLALTLLAAGAGAFHSAHQYASQLQQKVRAADEAWQLHTQQLAAAQSEQATLTDRVRELKQNLAQSPAVTQSALWSALQTDRVDRLPPELRERLLEELGFNWQSAKDFIVVSKQTVRDLRMEAVRDGKLTDVTATVLALTPEERGQIEAAAERVMTDFKEWMLAHVERTEPKDDVLAQYALPKDPAMSRSISNSFAIAVFGALGRERAELILPSAQKWMKSMGLYDCDARPPRIFVKRSLKGNEQRLEIEITSQNGGGNTYSGELSNHPQWGFDPYGAFPRAFRIIFPNGWPDVARREGFELPEKSQKK